VRITRDFPRPEALRVRLPDRRLIAEDIGLRQQLPHLDREIGADLPAAAVHDEGIEDRGERMHGVDVRREPRRGLRMAGREQALGLQAAEDVDRVRRAHGSCRRGEDVVRQRVVRHRAAVGDVERAVARRVPHFQRLDADPLRRDADPRVAGSDEMVVRLEPVDVEIVTRRHVVPLEDDRPVESRGILRTADDDARFVRMAAVEDAAVGVGGRLVAVRRSLDEELLLDVALAREVANRRIERVIVRGVADRHGRRDGSGHGRSGRTGRARGRQPRHQHGHDKGDEPRCPDTHRTSC